MAQGSKDIEEPELLRRVLAGDPAAGDEFHRRFRDRLYRVAVAFLGYWDAEAEDVVQETFESALRGLAGFEGRSSLYTWLNQICVRACYRRIRQRRRLDLGLETGQAERLGLATPLDETLHRILDEERRGLLRGWLERLGGRCRDLLRRRDLEGQPYAALARALKVPIGTVMSRLARCRESLRRLAAGSGQGKGHG